MKLVRPLIKWKSTSTCFTLECMMGLTACFKVQALILSVNNIGRCALKILSFLRTYCNQINSKATRAKALHFDSSLDFETILCLDDIHKTKLSPNDTLQPLVLCLSSRHSTQLESIKLMSPNTFDFYNISPWLNVPFKYLKILFATCQ